MLVDVSVFEPLLVFDPALDPAPPPAPAPPPDFPSAPPPDLVLESPPKAVIYHIDDVIAPLKIYLTSNS